MTVLVPLVIYFLLPLLGAGMYWHLCQRMSKQGVELAQWRLFIVLATYGGWLMVLLTGMFWRWSGMASLGTFYLLLVAPWLMVAIAVRTARQQQFSAYHRWIFRASAVYLPVVAGFILLAVLSK